MEESQEPSLDWSDQNADPWAGTDMESPQEEQEEVVDEVEEEESEETQEDEQEDEDEGDESESDEEVDEESTDEEDEQEDEQEEYEEEEDGYKDQYENMRNAMKAERGKRQEEARLNKELSASIESYKGSAESSEARLANVLEQLDALELSDVIDIPKEEKIDPRLQVLLEQQQDTERSNQIEAFYGDMRTEVSEIVGDYNNLDVTSSVQGDILSKMIVSNVSTNNMELGDATKAALDQLDGLLESVVKTYKTKRQPIVKPKKKVRSSNKARTPSTVNKRRKEMEAGNYKGFFGDLSKSMID